MTRFRIYLAPSIFFSWCVVATPGCGKSEKSPDGSGGDGDGDVTAGDGDGPMGDGGSDSPGDGGGASGGTPGSSGGAPGDGGASGGASLGGAGLGGDGSGATDGMGGAVMRVDGPCDIYEDAGSPCAAAYSMIRSLRREYTGPLYQIRVGSSPYNIGGERVTDPEASSLDEIQVPQQTVPEVGQLVDVRQGADGFADVSELEASCESPTICTVSVIYDQSGNGTDMGVAGKGGPFKYTNLIYAHLPNFETEVNDDALVSVGGRRLYSLRTDPREGYYHYGVGTGMPVDDESQEIYMLTDGTRVGDECCFEFSNAPVHAATYSSGTALFFGDGSSGRGESPPGAPWFGMSGDFIIYMGGSEPGDPGWGTLDFLEEEYPANQNNPSMQGVPFALGLLKTGTDEHMYALRMADIETASDLKTAYSGPLPTFSGTTAPVIELHGSVSLGIGGRNRNGSYGTFYEGAIIAGYPDDSTELEVLKNIQALGYGQ